jgi:rRNA maturation endonuclease Nob1
MKILAALSLSCLLAAGSVVAGETNEADQKWVQVVEKMVANGDRKITTPSETRVNLLKDWAAKNGYSLSVTKTDTGFSVEVSAKDKPNSVAQK